MELNADNNPIALPLHLAKGGAVYLCAKSSPENGAAIGTWTARREGESWLVAAETECPILPARRWTATLAWPPSGATFMTPATTAHETSLRWPALKKED